MLLALVTCAVLILFNGSRREGAHLTEDKLRVVVETVFLVLQLSFALLCKFKLASFCVCLVHRLQSGLFGHWQGPMVVAVLAQLRIVLQALIPVLLGWTAAAEALCVGFL